MASISQTTFKRWQCNPADFVEEALIDPETGKPFRLLDAERAFLDHAYRLDADGRLLFPEQLYAAPKKSGKTGSAALHTLTTVLLFGGKYAEAFCCANDLEQSVGRVFKPSVASLSRRHCWPMPRSPETALRFRSSATPQSRQSPPIMLVQPVLTLRSQPSMSCGASLRSAAIVYGTKWFHHQPARSPAA